MGNRRDVLTGLAGLAALGAGRARAAGPVAGQPAPAPNLALDLDDPQTSLRAYIKLRGSLDGAPVYDMAEGTVHGLVAGQPARPLFRMVGAQVTSYARESALEYSARSRYVGILRDWQTGEPLQEWTNPYNGARCEVPVTRYGPAEFRFLGDRMVTADQVPDPLPRATRPWFLLGDVVHMVETVVSSAGRPELLPDADLMTFSGDWRQLADPARARIPARLSFTAIEPWRAWMRMTQPGSLWWHVAGVKLAGPGGYPGWLRDLLLKADPAFFSPGSP